MPLRRAVPGTVRTALAIGGLWAPATLALAPGIAAQPLPAGEDPEFTPTTTVRWALNGVIGALRYEGSAVESGTNTAAGFPLLNAVSVNHDARLTIDTSFTGQDLFRIRLRSGDFGPSGFFSTPPTPLTRLDFAFQEPRCDTGGDNCQLITVNRAYLQVPIGPDLRVSVGPRVMQLDMLPVWPSAYNASPILDLFQFAGAPGAYGKRLGGGFGAWWQPRGALKGLSLGYAYVAPRAGDASRGGGLFAAGTSQTSTLQLAWSRPQWNITGAWTLSGPPVQLRGTPLTSQLAGGARDGVLGSWSVAGYWQPLTSGWIPSASVGGGYDSFRFATFAAPGVSGARTRSWYAGLVWSDVLGPGNNLGFAIGSPSHVSALQGPGVRPIDDRGLAYELYYQIQLSDHLSLTPAAFWLTRPRGALSGLEDGGTLGVWAGLLRTTLRF